MASKKARKQEILLTLWPDLSHTPALNYIYIKKEMTCSVRYRQSSYQPYAKPLAPNHSELKQHKHGFIYPILSAQTVKCSILYIKTIVVSNSKTVLFGYRTNYHIHIVAYSRVVEKPQNNFYYSMSKKRYKQTTLNTNRLHWTHTDIHICFLCISRSVGTLLYSVTLSFIFFDKKTPDCDWHTTSRVRTVTGTSMTPRRQSNW